MHILGEKMIWTLMEKPNVAICTVVTLDEMTELFEYIALYTSSGKNKHNLSCICSL